MITNSDFSLKWYSSKHYNEKMLKLLSSVMMTCMHSHGIACISTLITSCSLNDLLLLILSFLSF